MTGQSHGRRNGPAARAGIPWVRLVCPLHPARLRDSGLGYIEIFTKLHLFQFGLKRADLKFYHYSRNSSFSSFIITAGVNFVLDQ